MSPPWNIFPPFKYLSLPPLIITTSDFSSCFPFISLQPDCTSYRENPINDNGKVFEKEKSSNASNQIINSLNVQWGGKFWEGKTNGEGGEAGNGRKRFEEEKKEN
jgi:hypothetical protein